ncbi:hypothetical protein KP509_22G046000 [Ceratopteris richardii]|uniref:Ubiquitin-like domain-containing protein n=1 Tax=Ceratopteris richardii TaxID=49495 RepID=A0A8T2S4M3_CERRI|nr:hypothetical protein KP509_22G046000 [Ceratopteris richardii]
MQIFVKNVIGKTLTIDIDSLEKETTFHLKQKIEKREAIEPDNQRLIYGSKQLVDEKTLAEQGIHNLATIHMVLRLPGGNM